MDSGPGDEMLLLAVAERDKGAFRTLYERHAGWLAIRLARRGNAAGRVWLADQPDPAASVSWRTGTGRYRNLGTHVPDEADLLAVLCKLSTKVPALRQVI
jgi:hypothetical protein